MSSGVSLEYIENYIKSFNWRKFRYIEGTGGLC